VHRSYTSEPYAASIGYNGGLNDRFGSQRSRRGRRWAMCRVAPRTHAHRGSPAGSERVGRPHRLGWAIRRCAHRGRPSTTVGTPPRPRSSANPSSSPTRASAEESTRCPPEGRPAGQRRDAAGWVASPDAGESRWRLSREAPRHTRTRQDRGRRRESHRRAPRQDSCVAVRGLRRPPQDVVRPGVDRHAVRGGRHGHAHVSACMTDGCVHRRRPASVRRDPSPEVLVEPVPDRVEHVTRR
jgi:hypothetical protein